MIAKSEILWEASADVSGSHTSSFSKTSTRPLIRSPTASSDTAGSRVRICPGRRKATATTSISAPGLNRKGITSGIQGGIRSGVPKQDPEPGSGANAGTECRNWMPEPDAGTDAGTDARTEAPISGGRRKCRMDGCGRRAGPGQDSGRSPILVWDNSGQPERFSKIANAVQMHSL